MRRGPRNAYGEPETGTKIATLRDLLLRPQGVTSHEARLRLGFSNSSGFLGCMMTTLEDMCGYSIRGFPTTDTARRAATPNVRKSVLAYKITARYAWDGTVVEDYGAGSVP